MENTLTFDMNLFDAEAFGFDFIDSEEMLSIDGGLTWDDFARGLCGILGGIGGGAAAAITALLAGSAAAQFLGLPPAPIAAIAAGGAGVQGFFLGGTAGLNFYDKFFNNK